MVLYYIVSFIISTIILLSIFIIKKLDEEKENSKYCYWNNDKLKMETWQEYKKE